jgi:hypothetical protein
MADIDSALRRLVAPGAPPELAAATRSALIAARAVVEEALASGMAGSPGNATDAEEFVGWLSGIIVGSNAVAGMAGEATAWLTSSGAPSSTSLLQDERPAPVASLRPAGGVPAGGSLESFYRSFYDDAGVREAVGGRGGTAPSGVGEAPRTAWKSAQLQILRLPAESAGVWRSQLWPLRSAPGPEGNRATWTLVRGDREEDLVRPWGPGEPGVGASPSAPLHPRLGALLRDGAEASRSAITKLVPLVSNIFTMAEIDPALKVCLEAISSRSMEPLDPSALRDWQDELIDRMSCHLSQEDPFSPEGVGALLRVDEAVHGVAHLPVATRNSWWECTQSSVRAIVKEHVRSADGMGTKARCFCPEGVYSSVVCHTRQDQDLKVDRGGKPGHVLLCLRMWSEVAGQEVPGRVIFRGRD